MALFFESDIIYNYLQLYVHLHMIYHTCSHPILLDFIRGVLCYTSPVAHVKHPSCLRNNVTLSRYDTQCSVTWVTDDSVMWITSNRGEVWHVL